LPVGQLPLSLGLSVALEGAEVAKAYREGSLGDRVVARSHHLLGSRHPNAGQPVLEAGSGLVVEELGEVPGLHGGDFGGEGQRNRIRVVNLDETSEATKADVVGEGVLGRLEVEGRL
jgi:hypothetical protein